MCSTAHTVELYVQLNAISADLIASCGKSSYFDVIPTLAIILSGGGCAYIMVTCMHSIPTIIAPPIPGRASGPIPS